MNIETPAGDAPAPTPAEPVGDTPTPAPVDPTPSDPSPTPEPTPSPEVVDPKVNEPDLTPTEFKLPDEYKDKPWASKIKSEEDLYKQIDNLNTLVGKKTVAPDFENSTPEDIEKYFASTRPEDKGAYQFEEGTDENYLGAVQDMFHANGISAYQGNKIIESFQQFETAKLEAATDADGFADVMKESFGDKYDPVVAGVAKHHKQFMSADDQAMVDAMPNEYLGMMYRYTNKMLSEYGVDESGANVGGETGKVQTASFEEKTSKIRAEMQKISKLPDQSRLPALQAELDALYQNKVKGVK